MKKGDKTLSSAMRLKKKKAAPKKRSHHADGGSKAGYRKEQKRDQAPPADKKDRAARNRAHAKVNPPKGREVHHKDGNPRNNSKKNLSTVSVKFNRSESNRRRAKKRR